MGWTFIRHETAAFEFRIELLIKILVRMRGQPLLALLDNVQEAIADALVGPSMAILDG